MSVLNAEDTLTTYIIRTSKKVEALELFQVSTTHTDQLVDFVNADHPVAFLRRRVARLMIPTWVIVFAFTVRSTASPRIIPRFAQFLEILQNVFNGDFF